MARPLRLELSGAVYHVTARGNARETIFADDRDRQRFVDLFAQEVEQQHWCCHAWCLMGNYYHLLFETPEPNLIDDDAFDRFVDRLDSSPAPTPALKELMRGAEY